VSADSGEFWRCTLIESESRLRAARGIAKNETEAAIEAFEQLKGRGQRHSAPPLVSDGWGGYEMRRWWRCGGRCPSIREEDALRPRSGPSRLSTPTDGQAARKWSGDGSEGEVHLRR
jgi:hypothetical protein